MRIIQSAKGPIQTTVRVPGSKAITYRALLLAALADGVSEISGLHLSDEIRIFMQALHQLGIVIQLDEELASCIVAGGNGKFPRSQATIACGEKRIATRLLLSACAASLGVYYFSGTARNKKLKLKEFRDTLGLQGTQFIPTDANCLPITVVGADSLEGGEVYVDQLPKQLRSALMLIAPYARSAFNFIGDGVLQFTGVELTAAMMAEFGVLVQRRHHGKIMIPVPQRYQARDYLIEPDCNIAAYFYAAAALTNGQINTPPIDRHLSKQKSIRFLATLEKMGCTIQSTPNALMVKGVAELKGIAVSMPDCKAIFAILAILGIFTNAPIKMKWTNQPSKYAKKRISLMQSILKTLQVKTEITETTFKIYPQLNLQAITIDCEHDPYLSMAFCLLGLKIPGLNLVNAESAEAYCPDFFTLWEKMITGATAAEPVSA